MEEEFLKNKNMMRLERSVNGDGDTCVEEKKQEKKKEKKEKEKKRMDGRRGSIENKKNKKSQLNITIIFSQYFTINFK